MPVSVITISRQMGSYGNEIARQVAEHLGWQQISQDLINQAARDAKVPQVALADIDELGFLGLRPSTKEWRAYQAEVARTICQLADQGHIVIIGRGGQMVLRDRPGILHVRIVAPLEVRIIRSQQRAQISAEAAKARLKASDKARARYLRKGYNATLDDPTLYHLVVNTGLLEVSKAVSLILQAHQIIESDNIRH